MSLDPERRPMIYPVFLWLEISGYLERVGDGALAEAIRQTMSGRRLGADASFDLTEYERARVQAVVAE
ncbi:MAG: hypothetical protein M3Q71_22500 [Chloroflexota bacterium]|nr:hypothetical protein [Chloroflexota bacterium]